jgi:hypothetical protein
MSVQRFQITSTTVPFGKAEVFLGDATVSGGMTPIGLIEGDVVAELARKFNNLTFPEYTGDAVIKQKTQIDGITVTLPIMLTDKTMMARLSPAGVLDLGADNFKNVVPKTLLVISQEEVDPTVGLALAGGVWAPAAPKNALWIWKAVPQLNRAVWGFTDLGKRIVEVPVVAIYDTTKPADLKLACWGDPVAQGVTGLNI